MDQQTNHRKTSKKGENQNRFDRWISIIQSRPSAALYVYIYIYENAYRPIILEGALKGESTVCQLFTLVL